MALGPRNMKYAQQVETRRVSVMYIMQAEWQYADKWVVIYRRASLARLNQIYEQYGICLLK